MPFFWALLMDKRKRKRWTRKEDKYLEAQAHRLSAKDIGRKLKRTPGAVKSRAKRLGVHLQKHGEHHHLAKTSNQDVELCRALRDEKVKVRVIAEKMGIGHSLVTSVVNYHCRHNG